MSMQEKQSLPGIHIILVALPVTLLIFKTVMIKSVPLFSEPEYSKKLDTIGNCQRPVFSLCVSQHMHKVTNLRIFELNWSSNLRENNERKNTLQDA